MTIAVFFFMLFSGALAQILIPPCALLAQAKVPLLLGVVVYYAMAQRRGLMLWAAIGAGLLQDALTLTPLGYSVLWFCAFGLLINRFRDGMFPPSVPTAAALGLILGIVTTFATYLLLHVGATPLVAISAGRAAWRAAGTGLLGFIVAPAIFLVAVKLEHLAGLRKEEAA